MKKQNNVGLFKVGLIVVIICFFLLVGRISYECISDSINGIDLKVFASNRTTRKTIIKARRGNIYDNNGNILSQDVSSYTVIAYLDSKRTIDPDKPQHVVDKEGTALVLSKLLDMDYKNVLNILNKENLYQVEFGSKGRGLNEIKKDTIKSAKLAGIDFIENTKRYYPYGNFCSYVIGYAKTNDNGDTVGEMGVEKYFNDRLVGTPGYTEYQKDLKGYKIAGTKEVNVPSIDGNDIYLTIDTNVQLFIEDALKKYFGNAKSMSIVVSDKNGRILGSANYPSFDPNVRDITNYLDDVYSNAFEPGSTMKIYTYMAAMEAGVYKGSDTYKSGKFVTKDNTVISDWNNYGWGVITFDKGFTYSSNTAVVNIMDKYMDANTLKKYLIKMGFGKKTGISVPLEASGKIDFKYETEIFNAAFGQGITTTPIQHIKALTSIANDGYLLNPYIIDKIVDSDGNVVFKGEKEVLGRVASNDTISKIKNLMYNTVNEPNGAASSYKISGYNIIGKSGTAQVAKTDGSGYLTGSDSTHRSIALMFPKDDPEIIIYAVSKFSNNLSNLSNVVKEVVKNVSKYYNIYSKGDNNTSGDVFMGNYINKDVDSIKDAFSNKVYILGDGNKIIDTYPVYGSKLSINDKVFILTNSNNINMINLVGFSKNEASSFCKLSKINCKFNGNGYVTSQSIKSGVLVKKDDEIVIELKMLY